MVAGMEGNKKRPPPNSPRGLDARQVAVKAAADLITPDKADTIERTTRLFAQFGGLAVSRCLRTKRRRFLLSWRSGGQVPTGIGHRYALWLSIAALQRFVNCQK